MTAVPVGAEESEGKIEERGTARDPRNEPCLFSFDSFARKCPFLSAAASAAPRLQAPRPVGAACRRSQMKRVNREAKRYRDRHFFPSAMVGQPESNERGADDDRPVDITKRKRHLTFALFKSRTPHDDGSDRYREIGGKN